MFSVLLKFTADKSFQSFRINPFVLPESTVGYIFAVRNLVIFPLGADPKSSNPGNKQKEKEKIKVSHYTEVK